GRRGGRGHRWWRRWWRRWWSGWWRRWRRHGDGLFRGRLRGRRRRVVDLVAQRPGELDDGPRRHGAVVAAAFFHRDARLLDGGLGRHVVLETLPQHARHARLGRGHEHAGLARRG